MEEGREKQNSSSNTKVSRDSIFSSMAILGGCNNARIRTPPIFTHVLHGALPLEMPKTGGRRQRRPPRPRSETGTPAGAEVCRGAEEDESEGELGQEDLEGLEVEDMERIARMGL